MEFYRHVYKNSPRWDGIKDIAGERVIIYFEQGLGDSIQFSRYIPLFQQYGCKLAFHCPQSMFRLFQQFNPEMMLSESETNLPDHACHILSMSLPFCTPRDKAVVPYINVSEKKDLEEHKPFFKIGIAWEGNPEHSNNMERSCPLIQFRKLLSDNVRLFMIQNKVHTMSLLGGAKHTPLYSVEIKDFLDTAELMNALDLVISVDTSPLHLAGAMGKNAIGLLSHRYDPRWDYGDWYPSIDLIKQKEDGDWNGVFHEVVKRVAPLSKKQ
jgi:hypothetical protein